ncbi:hypothetical protein [Rhodococcus sp. USK13]|uniref:hypothetical protein n=1 Tax=Rhodococcus sp. USK13 TaxID=2806442 RepID=UPI001BCEBCC7|nr:hypothetical protein [Rhodococcus sp. USK13]
MTEDATPQRLHLIDGKTREHLERLVPAINQYADLLCDHSSPRPGSAFAAEEGVLTIRSPRDAVTVVGLNALDHLHLAATSVLNSSRITAFATFTLVRSAITAAGLAGWLLASDDSIVRQTRTLNLTYHELKNERTAARELVGQDKPDLPEHAVYNARHKSASAAVERLTARLEDVKMDAVRIGAAADMSKEALLCVTDKPTDTSMIGEATKLVRAQEYYEDFGAKQEVVRVWRTMSAHAHGLSWAAEMTTARGTDANGREVTLWNPQGEDLLQGIQVAWDLLYGMAEKYIELLGARPTEGEVSGTD